MWFGDRILTGKMFVGCNLIGQLMLLNRSSVARSLRRPLGVVANLVLKVVGQPNYHTRVKNAPLCIDLPSFCRE